MRHGRTVRRCIASRRSRDRARAHPCSSVPTATPTRWCSCRPGVFEPARVYAPHAFGQRPARRRFARSETTATRGRLATVAAKAGRWVIGADNNADVGTSCDTRRETQDPTAVHSREEARCGRSRFVLRTGRRPDLRRVGRGESMPPGMEHDTGRSVSGASVAPSGKEHRDTGADPRLTATDGRNFARTGAAVSRAPRTDRPRDGQAPNERRRISRSGASQPSPSTNNPGGARPSRCGPC